jgi:hypothetical protein
MYFSILMELTKEQPPGHFLVFGILIGLHEGKNLPWIRNPSRHAKSGRVNRSHEDGT